jgi:hypothetical protein
MNSATGIAGKTMIKGFDQATQEIEGDLATQISWLTPQGERHFDPATIVVTLAGVLLSSFLAGFTAEAKKAGKELGKATFRGLEAIVKNVFARAKNPEKEKLDQLAREAPKLAARAKRDELMLYANRSEDMLRVWLEASMPADRAAALASKIRKAAVEHVLSEK